MAGAKRHTKSLRVPRERAQTQIGKRIEDGQQLLAEQINDEKTLKAVRQKYYTWTEYNETMLSQLTDSKDLVDEYRSHIGIGIGPTSFEYEVQDTRDDIQEKVRRLESISERIELFDEPQASSMDVRLHRPKVFIAHGGHSDARDYLELSLWRNGYRPIVVEEMPSLGMNPDAKVRHYIDQSEFGVIFAEANKASTQDGKMFPRLNVVDEIARIRQALRSRFIVLLENGLVLPSNESGAITWERFESSSLDGPVQTILRELNAQGVHGLNE